MSASDQDRNAQMRRIGVRAFRGNMADVSQQVRLGASFLITSRDEVLAEIHPPSTTALPRRQLGALRGKIWMADDFDALPPDVLSAMEGEEA